MCAVDKRLSFGYLYCVYKCYTYKKKQNFFCMCGEGIINFAIPNLLKFIVLNCGNEK